jgi:integrase
MDPTAERRFGVSTRLTNEKIVIAEQAFDRMGNIPASELIDAVAQYVEHRTSNRLLKTVIVETAIAEFITAKEAEDLRGRSIGDLRTRLGQFEEANGTKPVSSITVEQVKKYVAGDGTIGPQTRKNNLTVLSGFFAWAMDQKYTQENPCKSVNPPRVSNEAPKAFSLERVKKILQTAQEIKGGILLPWVVLGLWCGLRPEEINKVQWNAIDLKNGHIKLDETVTKVGRRRVVELHETAVQWMKLAEGKTIKPKVRDIAEFKDMAGFTPRRRKRAGLQADENEWISDGLRHTAISYTFALNQDEAKTAYWAGNSPAVIKKHYLHLVTPQESAQFWNIIPPVE